MSERLNAQAAPEALQRILSGRYRSPQGALFTVALFRGKDSETFLAARVLFGDQQTPARRRADYRNLILLEEWVEPLDTALERAREVLKGKWTVSNHRIEAPFDPDWEAEWSFDPSASTFSGWHEWVLKGDAPYNSRPNVPLGDPVVAVGLPPYRSGGEAVNEWVWGERRPQAMRLGEALIIMPDTRGRIAAADWSTTGEISVEIDLNIPREEVELQAYFEDSSARDKHEKSPENRISLQPPEDAKSIWLYLVHKSGDQLSEIYLSSYMRRPVGQQQEVATTTQQRAEEEIRNGEGVEVEFKPFITPRHEKEFEVVRTIVAFANTRGGRIYFGVVEKAGVVQGVKYLYEAYGKSPTKAREEFEAHMRKLIGDKVRGHRLKYNIDFVEIHGEPVGVLAIEAGEEPPYSTSDDEVLIRKGSSNKRPDAQTELVQLCTRGRAAAESSENLNLTTSNLLDFGLRGL